MSELVNFAIAPFVRLSECFLPSRVDGSSFTISPQGNFSLVGNLHDCGGRQAALSLKHDAAIDVHMHEGNGKHMLDRQERLCGEELVVFPPLRAMVVGTYPQRE